MSVHSTAESFFARASKVSILRHFVFAAIAAYLIAAGPAVSHIADSLVSGAAVSGDDAKSLLVAAEIAVGTAITGVVVPEIGLLALRAKSKSEE